MFLLLTLNRQYLLGRYCTGERKLFVKDVLEDEKLLRWRLLKTSWRHVLKTSWRHYREKQNAYWGYLYLTNLNVYLTNLYLTNLHLTILRRIQNALSRTHHFNICLIWNSSSISISRIKISDDCLMLWNQLNSNSTLQERRDNKNEFLSNILHKHI